VTAPVGRRLAGWLGTERPLARARPAAAPVGALSAGALAGCLAARGEPWGWIAPGPRSYVVVLAAMAVALAAGNGYAKAYSP
jgi:hypothetical protein